MDTREKKSVGVGKVDHITSSDTEKDGPSDMSEPFVMDPADEKRLLRKLDWNIYPPLLVVYTMAYLDRINISNAKIQGLVEDLDLTGNRFNITLFVSTHTRKSRSLMMANHS